MSYTSIAADVTGGAVCNSATRLRTGLRSTDRMSYTLALDQEFSTRGGVLVG